MAIYRVIFFIPSKITLRVRFSVLIKPSGLPPKKFEYAILFSISDSEEIGNCWATSATQLSLQSPERRRWKGFDVGEQRYGQGAPGVCKCRAERRVERSSPPR